MLVPNFAIHHSIFDSFFQKCFLKKKLHSYSIFLDLNDRIKNLQPIKVDNFSTSNEFCNAAQLGDCDGVSALNLNMACPILIQFSFRFHPPTSKFHRNATFYIPLPSNRCTLFREVHSFSFHPCSSQIAHLPKGSRLEPCIRKVQHNFIYILKGSLHDSGCRNPHMKKVQALICIIKVQNTLYFLQYIIRFQASSQETSPKDWLGADSGCQLPWPLQDRSRACSQFSDGCSHRKKQTS